MVTFERGSAWRALRDKLVETGVAADREPYAVATSIIQRASPAGRGRLLKKYLGLSGMSSNPRRRGRFIKGSAEAKAYMAKIRALIGRAKDTRKKPRVYDGRRWKPISTSSDFSSPMAVRRRRRAFTIPLAPIMGLAAGVIEPVQWALSGYPDPATACRKAACKAISNYTGVEFDPNSSYVTGWSIGNISRGLLPLVIGLLVHKFVGGAPLNLNRTLGRARVPFIRI